jgi:hypothetical protein
LALLDDETADRVLEAVKVASISEARFTGLEISAELTARFRRLCDVLASIDTIKDASIFSRENLTTYTYAIQVLEQLHSLTIDSLDHDLGMMSDFSTALQGHPTLQNCVSVLTVVIVVFFYYRHRLVPFLGLPKFRFILVLIL